MISLYLENNKSVSFDVPDIERAATVYCFCTWVNSGAGDSYDVYAADYAADPDQLDAPEGAHLMDVSDSDEWFAYHEYDEKAEGEVKREICLTVRTYQWVLEEPEEAPGFPLDMLADWRAHEIEHEWYALDECEADKDRIVRRQVGTFDEIAAKAVQYVRGDGLVTADGTHAAPGEFGEAPFWRVVLILPSEAREFYEFVAMGKEQALDIAPHYVGTREASERLGVNRQRVHQLIAAGQLEAKLIAGTWFVSLPSIERRLAASPKSGRPKKS
jgi:hypothetical protein